VKIMGGFYVDKYNQYREIHWACRRCVVRPICNERCDKLSLIHWLCEDCKKDIADQCNDACDRVISAQRFEFIQHIYGDVMENAMIKHLEETSFVRVLRKPEKTSWWPESAFKQS